MPREVKQARHAFLEKAIRGVAQTDFPLRLRGGGSSGSTSQLGSAWFQTLDPVAMRAASDSLPVTGAAPFAVSSLFTFVRSTLTRAMVPILWAGAVVAAFLRGRGVCRIRKAPASSPHSKLHTEPIGERRGIQLDRDRLVFRGCRQVQPLLLLDAPFGVTLLATPRRDRLVAVLSSSLGTFSLGASFDASARRAFAPLFDRASTVCTDEDGLHAVGPDGDALIFAPDELASILDALVERNPNCLERFVLSDAHGAAITFDGQLLRAGERSVDLCAPLEWRSILFQEAFGQAVAVYQGTWVRQSGTEFVLVALLPSLTALAFSDPDSSTLDRAVLRDLRLMQAAASAPPPTEQRVAIERLFMLPVRSVLDRAPSSPQTTSRASA